MGKYDELLKAIDNCHECLCGECKYKHLQRPGNFVRCMDALMTDAAFAIGELSFKYEGVLKQVEPSKRET